MLKFGIYKVDVKHSITPPKRVFGDSREICKNNSNYIDYVVAYSETLKEAREK